MAGTVAKTYDTSSVIDLRPMVGGPTRLAMAPSIESQALHMMMREENEEIVCADNDDSSINRRHGQAQRGETRRRT